MGATELDDVSALLQRVLPDPAGFAERLLDQFVSRWGVTSAGRSGGSAAMDPEEDAGAPPVVLAPRFVPHSLDALTDSNVLLASALGACDCWGLQDDCVVCKGKGEPGWVQPDVELFQVFVGPAVARLADAGLADGHDPGTKGNAS
ncbi:hypothetical protein [Knoellia aerolata]|uniref:Uncharacterized protein n=1 Tax=Knoellia aerolata DSM 18566 TaxID=1385519 RepID=A0A0A0JTD6_9MICO|nr:hypothetical protein [Knoellia aerolata]KGN39944.1 hypothetical protein N801_17715 [Knoellia aerolata DSM 18566]